MNVKNLEIFLLDLDETANVTRHLRNRRHDSTVECLLWIEYSTILDCPRIQSITVRTSLSITYKPGKSPCSRTRRSDTACPTHTNCSRRIPLVGLLAPSSLNERKLSLRVLRFIGHVCKGNTYNVVGVNNRALQYPFSLDFPLVAYRLRLPLYRRGL